MLDTFRKHSNSTLIYLIFGALIFVFIVSFGQGSAGFKSGAITGSTEFAAKVNDETISVREFNRAYQMQLAQMQERAGQQITEEMADALGFRKQTLDRMVEQTLLVQAAKRRGLAISDAELASEIAKVPSFQKDGAFDKESYEKVLTYQGSTAADFENKQRDNMLLGKMAALVMSSAVVTDDELLAEYNKEHDKAELSFVRFLPSQFMSEVEAKPSDADIEKFATSHAAQISEFYTRNSFRYHKPARVNAKDILVKSPEGAPADVDAKAKAKADEAYQALKSGKDFAAVAKEFSEDTSTKDKGGDMGAISPGIDKKLDEAIAKLTAGQYSEPVRTHFGYQIIQVTQQLPAEDKKLEDVKKEIATELMKTEAAKALAQKNADDALKAALDGKKLADQYPAAKKADDAMDFGGSTKLEAQDTGAFAAGEFVPKIGQAPEIAQAAFQLTAEKPVGPKVYEAGNAFYVVELKNREKPDPAEFAKQKEDIRQVILQRKQNDILTGYVKELREAGKVEENQALTMARNPAEPS